MISSSLILQILQAAKIMRRFFYEAPAEIMRNYTTSNNYFLRLNKPIFYNDVRWPKNLEVEVTNNSMFAMNRIKHFDIFE